MDSDELKFLLVDAQSGNKNSYKKFYDKVLPIIIYIVNAKVFNPDDRNDVVQDALLGIHKSLQSFDSSRDPLPWVKTITNYKIIDYIRKISKKNEHETLTPEGDVTIYGLSANSSIEDLRILGRLPESLRKPLMLAKLEGYSTTEIAGMMNIKENAVRTRISRAMKKLKKLLESDEEI